MNSRRVESFLLRVVVENGDAVDESWHGRIQHVSSGSEHQFNQFQDMLMFINSHLAHDPPQSCCDQPKAE